MFRKAESDVRRSASRRKAGAASGGVVAGLEEHAFPFVNVLYDGLLHTSGAQEVYLHVGYGPHYNWQKVRDLKMFRTGRGWEQTIEVNSPDRLNFCFKDSAENWDNNSGYNWSFEVHHGKMY